MVKERTAETKAWWDALSIEEKVKLLDDWSGDHAEKIHKLTTHMYRLQQALDQHQHGASGKALVPFGHNVLSFD